VTLDSALQVKKHLSQSIRTDDGMQIDEQYSNAPLSIRESLQLGSNVTLESSLQLQKHRSQRISTEDGMQIPKSDEQCDTADRSMRES
jgi:hypothetical protein